MAVINLGQFGSQRENPISSGLNRVSDILLEDKTRSADLSFKRQALAQEAALKREALASGERQHKETIEQRDRSEQNALLVSQASAEAKKKSKDMDLALSVYDRVMNSLAGKTPQEQEMILSSEQMVTLAKDLIKPNIPELVGEDGRLVSNIPEKPYVPRTREEKIQFEKDLSSAIEGVKSDRPLNAREIASITNALQILRFSGIMSSETVKEMQKKLAPRLETLLKNPKAGLDPESSDLSNPFTEALSTPGDPNDPLGIIQ